MKQRVILYIKYILFLSAIVFLHMYNNHIVTFIFLIMTIMFPVISVIWFFYSVKRVDISIGFEKSTVQRNQNVNLLIHIHNKSSYPITRLQGSLNIQHNYITNEYIHEYVFEAPARKKVTYSVPISLSICGCYQTKSLLWELWDYNGFVSKKVNTEILSEIVVMPNRISFDDTLSITNTVEAEENDPEKRFKGQDPSEILNIREFQQGDRLQLIHWKISAKEQRLMSKELSSICGVQYYLVVDYNFQNIRHIDVFFDLLYSFLMDLLKENQSFFVSWFGNGNQLKKWTEITGEDKINDIIFMLFYEKPGQNKMYITDQLSATENTEYLIITTRGYRDDKYNQIYNHKGIVKIYQLRHE